MLPAALSIVMNMFTEGAERNKALGVWGGLGATGATVGLIAGGFLTRYAGWQYIFYVNVPIGAAALALAPRVVPDSRLATTRRRFDAIGAVAGTGGLVLLVDAIAQAPEFGWGATRTIAVLAASAALLASFLVIESRTNDPVLPLSIFRQRTVAGANVAGLLLGGSFFAFVFVGTLYMQQVLHYSALQTGVVDGQENPLVLIDTAKLYEVQKYCSLTNHIWAGLNISFSKIAWNRLPKDLQELSEKHFNEKAQQERDDWQVMTQKEIENLKSKGMTFNSPDPKPFQDALRKTDFYQEMKKKSGEQAWTLLEGYVGNLA